MLVHYMDKDPFTSQPASLLPLYFKKYQQQYWYKNKGPNSTIVSILIQIHQLIENAKSFTNIKKTFNSTLLYVFFSDLIQNSSMHGREGRNSRFSWKKNPQLPTLLLTFYFAVAMKSFKSRKVTMTVWWYEVLCKC